MRVFYDTSALLNIDDYKDDEIVISSITLVELERIKVSRDKDECVKAKARRVSRFLRDTQNLEIILPKRKVKKVIKKFGLVDNNDSIILASAYLSKCDTVLSDDISFINIGRKVLGLKVEGTINKVESDNGYIEIQVTQEEFNQIIKETTCRFNIKVNSYVIFNIGEKQEIYKWTGSQYDKVQEKKIKSFHLGETIRALDPYQACAIDSLFENSLTAISGRAGSGKSTLALFAAMNLIEKRTYSRLIIMANPIPLRGVKEIGFLPGSKDEKLLCGNLGNILYSKFGDETVVRELIDRGIITIVNMADCRGMEIAKDEILYCTEIQNSSIDIIKMVLQRAKEGSKVFIEGDYEAQVDSYLFEGKSNGLKRVIDVFSGESYFGHIDLPTVHRSKIAEKANQL